MKRIGSHFPSTGIFDLQGFKPKTDRLPPINLHISRSVTPDFTSKNLTSTQEFSDTLLNTPRNKSPKFSEKFILPTDSASISTFIKPLKPENFILSPETKFSSSRQDIKNLEKWFFEALEKNQSKPEPVFLLCFQELATQISAHCHTKARLLVYLFENFKNYWKGQIKEIEKEFKTKEEEKTQQFLLKIGKLESDTEYFRTGMSEYLEKSVRTDEKNTFLTRENEILKQVIIRFQQEYKLKPINFSKICELIIEDLADTSKRTQKRILNSIIPKYCKSVKVQTIETLIVKVADKSVLCKVQCKDAEIDNTPELRQNSVQTNTVKLTKKLFSIVLQSSIRVHARTKSVKMTSNLMKKQTRLSLIKAEQMAPSAVITSSKENQLIFPNPPELLLQDNKESLETSNYFRESPRRNSNTITLNDSVPITDFQRGFTSRAYTPHPHKKLVNKRPVLYKKFQKAKEILLYCLKCNIRILINDSTMSLRTLLKTIESMFFSCIPYLRYNKFKGFLEHVYGRLTNKYSLKRMKERRLKDLIASSVRFKEYLTPKLFLRSIGAGELLGLTNYSIHTLKILLQILSYFNTHTFGSPLVTYNGRKMCQKNKALEFAKEIFAKRLDNIEYLRVIQQIEFHSEPDYHSNRGALIELEWTISYFIYTFDTFEKSVNAGLSQIMEAMTLNNNSVFPSKGEVLMGLRAIYKDWDKIVNDPNNWKTFPFLSPKVSEKSLVSSLLVERFCLYRGIFKSKHIAAFKKNEVKPVNDLIIDNLGFMLDNLNDSLFESSISKSAWQKKLESLKDSKEPDFAFAIFQKELTRVLQPPKPQPINY